MQVSSLQKEPFTITPGKLFYECYFKHIVYHACIISSVLEFQTNAKFVSAEIQSYPLKVWLS